MSSQVRKEKKKRYVKVKSELHKVNDNHIIIHANTNNLYVCVLISLL